MRYRRRRLGSHARSTSGAWTLLLVATVGAVGCASLAGLAGGDKDAGEPSLDAGHDATTKARDGAPDGVGFDVRLPKRDASDAGMRGEAGPPDAPHDSSSDVRPADDAVTDARHEAIADAGHEAACVTVDASLGPVIECMKAEAGTCAPRSLEDASFPWHPPAQTIGACRPGASWQFINACIGADSSNAACNTFLASDGGTQCAACAISDMTQLTYGPLIATSSIVSLNYGGCFALTDPCNLACAKVYEDSYLCNMAACAPSCLGDASTVTDEQLNNFETCSSTANSCSCNPENQAAMPCQEVLSANPRSAGCLFVSTEPFANRAASLTSLFCGNGSLDAGPPDGAP